MRNRGLSLNQNQNQQRLSMIKLNIEQQIDEIRDIENFIENLDPIAVVELQSQQIRRLIYFARKGVTSYKAYRSKLHPALNQEVNVNEREN